MEIVNNKTGIMGGTFNPPHLGHLVTAEFVTNALKLDKTVFVPTGNISYKDTNDTLNAKDRYEMTKMAIEENPKFEISDVESAFDGYSYTYQTLKKLKEIYPHDKLYFIVGADSLDYMDRWRKPELIFANCTVAAVSRNGFSDEHNIRKADELKKIFGADIVLLKMPYIDISSTQIRCDVKNGTSIRYLVPDKVIDYIYKNNLYIGE